MTDSPEVSDEMSVLDVARYNLGRAKRGGLDTYFPYIAAVFSRLCDELAAARSLIEQKDATIVRLYVALHEIHDTARMQGSTPVSLEIERLVDAALSGYYHQH